MKIAAVCPVYPPAPGGVSDFAQRWARALAEGGDEVVVVTSPGAVEDAPGVKLVTHASWGAGGMAALRGLLAAEAPDVVVVHYVPHLYERRGASLSINLAVGAIAREIAPVVTLAHELYYGRHEGWKVQPFGGLQRLMLWPLFKASTRVVLTVPDRLNRMRAVFPRLAERFVLLPVAANLVPVEGLDREAWRASQGLEPGELALLFLGLAHPSKELPTLVTTLDRLATAGVTARLLVAGGGAVAHPRATTLGYIGADEAARALAGADLFLLPLGDGASTRRTSLMNALAAGLPVVSTRGVNTDVTLLGEALQLVPAGDTEAFAAAVVALAQDPAERQALGRRGRSLHDAAFGWDVLAGRWRALLAGVVNRTP